MSKKDIFGDEIKTVEQDEFSELLAQSEDHKSVLHRNLKAGEKITAAEILSIGKEESYVSTGTTQDAMIMTKELCEPDGTFKYKVGDRLDVFVSQIKKGEIRVSRTGKSNSEADSIEDAFDCMLPIEGRVSEVCNGGFRILIMGKTAFCPISQIDSKHVTDAQSYIGKKLDFMVTQFEQGGRNIVVSRRKLLDQQKEESEALFLDEHKPGDLLKGVVTRIEKFGAFVEIAPSLDGLVHISEVSWSRLENPSEVLSVGQVVEVKFLKSEIVDGKSKLSLSIKQASAQPWETHKDEMKIGSIVNGRVTNILKFGAFVQIKPGIEGLVPLSEMSYTKRIVKAEDVVKVGDTVRVMIKEIKPEDKKILLSIRDAEGDPWAMVISKYPVGSLVTGVIERKETFGYIIKIEDGISGLLPKNFYRDLTEGDWDHKKVGDSVQIQVAEIKFEDRKITLRPPNDEADESWKNYEQNKKSQGQQGMGSFGGAFGDQLKSLVINKK